MKSFQKLTAVFAATVMGLSVSFADTGSKAKAITYKANTSRSEITWNGKKVTGEHFGKVPVKQGSFTLNGTKLTAADFTADLSALTVEDIKDAEYNGKLVGHLKNDDFFSTDKFPEARFVLTKATAKAAGVYDVTGNLTIKGITKPVTFPATIKTDANGSTVTGKIVVDRSKYDIKYSSKSFFDANALGDKMIYDDFTLDVKIVAAK
jgi:polyisoprenoid-binding protein YceI